jgi:hypothetical protein
VHDHTNGCETAKVWAAQDDALRLALLRSSTAYSQKTFAGFWHPAEDREGTTVVLTVGESGLPMVQVLPV